MKKKLKPEPPPPVAELKPHYGALFQTGNYERLFGDGKREFYTQPILRFEPITGGVNFVHKLIIVGE